MQKDKQFRRADDWGLASDGVQWVLQRKNGKSWEGISFVRTLKAYLERCMCEKGVPPDAASQLLEGLPDTFEAWMNAQHDAVSRVERHPAADAPKSVMMPTDAPLSSLAA
jgi:hypothetical protein